MTALCPKQFADLLFSSGNETEALSYHQQALEMMKKLGMDGHKESILALKAMEFATGSKVALKKQKINSKRRNALPRENYR